MSLRHPVPSQVETVPFFFGQAWGLRDAEPSLATETCDQEYFFNDYYLPHICFQ